METCCKYCGAELNGKKRCPNCGAKANGKGKAPDPKKAYQSKKKNGCLFHFIGVAIVSAAIGIGMAAQPLKEGISFGVAALIYGLTFFFVISLLSFVFMGLITSIFLRKEQNNIAIEEKKRIGYIKKIIFCHFSGLPIASGIACTLYYCPDKITVTGSSHTFHLALDKIYDMALTQDVRTALVPEEQSIYGPDGVIGGYTSTRKVKYVTNYLVITYEKDGRTEYLRFNVTKQEYPARDLIRLFRQRSSTKGKTVNL